MWKLTIEDDEGKQTSLPLGHEEYGLGRAEANAIRLTDRNISRKHAILKRNGQGWFIKDLASYNGTYVNGGRVAGEQLISHGDIVQLGDYRLELIDESLTQPGTLESGAASQAMPSHYRPDRLVVVVGPTPGAEFPLDREYFTIGRAEDATISINHSSVSRLHAELIALGNGRYEIVDKGSANGIRINGVELKRGILEAGDALELGDVRLRFVGAGKIFRGIDQTHPMQVVGTFESVVPSVHAPHLAARTSASGRIVRYVGIGVMVGVIAIGAVVLTRRLAPRPIPKTIVRELASPATTDVGATLLRDARALAGSDDFDAAHAKLTEIPEASPARQDPAFKAIEAHWADAMLARAQAATDLTERRRLLNQIASTPTVDAERRKRAADLIRELDEQEAATEVEPPVPPAVAVANVTAPRTPASQQAPASPPVPAATATSKPAGDPYGTYPSAPSPVPEALDNVSTRKRLLPKLYSGKATMEELIQLRGACRLLGDNVCRDAATQAIKKKQQEEPR